MNTLISTDLNTGKLNNVEKKKAIQKIGIIKNLYTEGPKTNVEICRDFKISLPTSTALLNQLMEDSLVEKKGRVKSEGGRHPDLYGLRDGILYVLGIAVGRFKSKMGIFDNNNNPMSEVREFPIAISKDLSAADLLYVEAEALIADSGIDRTKLMGIGVNMPGLVDSTEGNNYTYLRTRAGQESLERYFTQKFNIPVYIQNDVKAMALAEFRFGQAKGKKDVLVISLDWGIGMGIIMDGKLLIGTTGFGGEIGHIPFDNAGELCYCGKKGCLETMASGIALSRMAKEGIEAGQDSLLNLLNDQELEQIEPQMVIDAAIRGDQFAIDLLAETGLNLGKGIAMLIQVFNPELVILGGNIAEAKEYITTPIQQSINKFCMEQIREKTRIRLSSLGEDSDVLGSVAVVMENIFKDYTDES